MDRCVALSLVSLLTTFLVLAPVASAQSTGTVTGRATDDNGRFTLQEVPPGTHRLEARFIGYTSATRTVTVTAGATTQV